MRRFVYGLLAMLVLAGALEAKVYTNKTFLMPRSHVDNMAMEYTTWHKQFRMIDADKWGGTFQATGFYQSSTNKKALAKYFGKYNSATGPNITNPYAGAIQNFIWVTERQALAGPANRNNEKALLLEADFLINGAATDALDVKGVLSPKQTSYGIRLDYHQKLDKLTDGLYLKISAPIVRIKNCVSMCYTGDTLKTTVGESEKTLADYLAGNIFIEDEQAKLCKAKICGCKSETGVADIEVTLGYNFLYEEHKHCGVYVSMTIPTGDAPDGEFLFQPVLGHGNHWAFGLGVDSAFELWQHGEKSLEFVGSIHYKYVLNGTEMRTLGFRYPVGEGVIDPYLVAGKLVPMGWYMLGAQNGKAGKFPLANVLTKRVGVEPGSQVEALAGLAFNWGDFTFDAGYNLFAKEKENVMLKGACGGNCGWADDTIAIADPSYDPAGAFGVNDAWNPWIQATDLDTNVAATPVYVTHKVYGGFGYKWSYWKDYPIMMGLGGSWEFTQGTNAALDGYALWAKLGVTF